MSEVWRLYHDGAVVAEFHGAQPDFPWLRAMVAEKPGFDALKPLFDEEVRLLDELTDTETAEWTSAYEAIRAQTRLTYPDGREVPEYLLHIDGDQAWWRWSDEPFDSG